MCAQLCFNPLTPKCACALVTANHERFCNKKKWRRFQRLEYTSLDLVDRASSFCLIALLIAYHGRLEVQTEGCIITFVAMTKMPSITTSNVQNLATILTAGILLIAKSTFMDSEQAICHSKLSNSQINCYRKLRCQLP